MKNAIRITITLSEETLEGIKNACQNSKYDRTITRTEVIAKVLHILDREANHQNVTRSIIGPEAMALKASRKVRKPRPTRRVI